TRLSDLRLAPAIFMIGPAIKVRASPVLSASGRRCALSSRSRSFKCLHILASSPSAKSYFARLSSSNVIPTPVFPFRSFAIISTLLQTPARSPIDRPAPLVLSTDQRGHLSIDPLHCSSL